MNFNNCNLYNQVHSDLFQTAMTDNLNDRDYFIPSFTTILLLQTQAYVVQLLIDFKESTSYIYQLIQWPLLIVLSVLDNVAYLLNLDHEINRLRDCQKKTPRDQDSSSSGNVTITKPFTAMVSPTPSTRTSSNYQKTSVDKSTSPLLGPTRSVSSGRTPSLSSSLSDIKQHTLRRVTAHRDIQGSMLPATSPQKKTKSSRRTVTPIPSAASPITPPSPSSSSGSSFMKESIFPGKLKMGKPKSLTPKKIVSIIPLVLNMAY
ncbi:hypothetical protein G6F46_006157 [Rhizopus delemar]|nr:hypothetical protein G6F55_003158 [Rhizopus delemar]KAG1544200.1 hypothetical protein G6F51_006217 [Rhizopus arrhizus]KAG1498014.1 hypothetical protein G6F54_005366 [Rhizopus delemar]KAG1509042.1 hypothetical protein G6F52_011238 [Rhizopus delemar]KAG1516150.1 hypothetical protein G6F53_002379 [Rhizopus delemar]